MKPKRYINLKLQQNLHGWIGGMRLGEPQRFFKMIRDRKTSPLKKGIFNRLIWIMRLNIDAS